MEWHRSHRHQTGISSEAVEEHRASLIRKTGLLSQAELTKLSVQLG